MLVLWQFEGCPHSKIVRQRLTDLALEYVSVNAPPGHPEKDSVMLRLFPSAKTPALWDTLTGTLLQGEDAINAYLSQYAGEEGEAETNLDPFSLLEI